MDRMICACVVHKGGEMAVLQKTPLAREKGAQELWVEIVST